MSGTNKPVEVVERSGNEEGLIQQYFRQPGISDATGTTPLPTTPTQSRLYECRFCKKTFSKPFYLIKHEKTHSFLKFYCWVCQHNFQMSQTNMGIHFKEHEIQVLRSSGYVKTFETTVIDQYEKQFEDDDWS